MAFPRKSADKSRARWMIRHYYKLRWDDGTISYSKAKSLITKVVHGTEEDDDNNDAVIYVKGHEKRQWLWNLLLDDERVYIETLDADYEDIDFLNNLNADNTMRCGYHYTNCALQNVFKLFNWWSDNHE
ncbi:hypothetical protein P5V15_012863 [Pogonomyrmex californicus]